MNNYLTYLWPYDHLDKTTHPWLGCEVHGEVKRKIVWIKNPNFKYAHLLKNWEGKFIEELPKKEKDCNVKK